jgi:hypothetical protein
MGKSRVSTMGAVLARSRNFPQGYHLERKLLYIIHGSCLERSGGLSSFLHPLASPVPFTSMNIVAIPPEKV